MSISGYFKKYLFLLALFLFVAGCSSSAAKTISDRGIKENIKKQLEPMVEARVADVSLKGRFDAPGFKVVEAKAGPTNGKKVYLQVDAKNGELLYVGLGDIVDSKHKIGPIDLNNSRKLAQKFAAENSLSFKGFKFIRSDKGLNWPKPGYVTFLWRKQKSNNFYAKVTIDGQKKEIVSFGKGTDKWSIFCLPPGYLEKDKK